MAVGQNFTAATLNVESSAVPPDANGVAGPLHYVEFVNGRFTVFNKTNSAKVTTMTDVTFWSQAGITLAGGWDVTDPRIIFDPASQRWFVSGVDFDPTGTINTNHMLLAISATADPSSAWKALSITALPGGNTFCDFPTLGLDAQGVYIAADLFDPASNPLGSTLVSLPKKDLLASTPVSSALTRFGIMSYAARGDILQPAVCLDGSGQGTVLSADGIGVDTNSNFITNTSLVQFQVQNAAGPGKATLGSSSFLSVSPYTAPLDPVQPDLSTNLDDGDARFSANVYEVGGVLYAVHGTQLGDRAALRWYRIDAASHTVLESGTVSDPVNDLYYPSIAANAAGIAVIAFNGSSSRTFLSSFAVVGRTVNGVTTFNKPVLLKSGTASYQNTDSTGTSRWGDFSTTCLDPSDSTIFWTIQEIATGASTWSTQVTEIRTGIPVISVSRSGSNQLLSWTGTLFNLQTTTNIIQPTWTVVTQNLSTNNGLVTAQVPLANDSGFFRLQAH
jgi:hypothetical protein